MHREIYKESRGGCSQGLEDWSSKPFILLLGEKKPPNFPQEKVMFFFFKDNKKIIIPSIFIILPYKI